MATEFHSGILAKAFIGPDELPITSWEVDPKSEMQVFRNSKTGRYSVKEPTFRDLDFALVIDYDFADNPFELTFPLTPGTKLYNVKLFLNVDDNNPVTAAASADYWDINEAFVVSTPQSVEVDGKIQTRINCTTSGQWGPPGTPVGAS